MRGLRSALAAAVMVGICASAAAAPARLAGRVFGFVWNAANEPIAKADVRLRNVTSGRVEAYAVTADNGEFSFEDLEGGTFVVECVDDHNRILGISHVFTVAPGEAVATFIRLQDRDPWFAALFGSAARAALTTVAAAATLGLTAVAPAKRQVTPER